MILENGHIQGFRWRLSAVSKLLMPHLIVFIYFTGLFLFTFVSQAGAVTDRAKSAEPTFGNVAVNVAFAPSVFTYAGALPGVDKVTIGPNQFAGGAMVDLGALVQEKSALGFVGSSDDEFLRIAKRCIAAESANSRILVFDKSVCVSGCLDITEKIKTLLKEGKNQDDEAPKWSGCGSWAHGQLVRSWPEAQNSAQKLSDLEKNLMAKVDACNQEFDRAKASGAGSQELETMQARLQGQINDLHKRISAEASKLEQDLENTLSYASSKFASHNELNYIFNDEQILFRCFDVTEPMGTYLASLKSPSAKALEGPNPYKIAVINSSLLEGQDRAKLELSADAVRRQKQLKLVVLSSAVRCGAVDITADLIEVLKKQ